MRDPTRKATDGKDGSGRQDGPHPIIIITTTTISKLDGVAAEMDPRPELDAATRDTMQVRPRHGGQGRRRWTRGIDLRDDATTSGRAGPAAAIPFGRRVLWERYQVRGTRNSRCPAYSVANYLMFRRNFSCRNSAM
jgi:hypothetical protein